MGNVVIILFASVGIVVLAWCAFCIFAEWLEKREAKQAGERKDG